MDFPYNDNLLEAHEVQPGWIAITWLYPGEKPFRTYRTFWKLDKTIKAQGFKGWLMASELSHENMHRHIMRVGGFPYAIDPRNIYFKKEVN